MKKSVKMIIVSAITIILFTSFNMPQRFRPKVASSVTTESSTQFTNYIWYKDEELTEITGTYSDVNVEINRLSLLFPGYTFSSYHMSGLYEYEYGYHSFLPMAIIYSNR